jgi:hypothetical protein
MVKKLLSPQFLEQKVHELITKGDQMLIKNHHFAKSQIFFFWPHPLLKSLCPRMTPTGHTPRVAFTECQVNASITIKHFCMVYVVMSLALKGDYRGR